MPPATGEEWDALQGDPAFRILLASTDRPRDADAIVNAWVGLSGDTASLLAMVRRHRVAPLVASGLAAAGIAVPDALSETARTDKLKALRSVAEASRLLELLAARNIETALLKGPVLAQSLYGDPAMRQGKDLDLLVAWEDFAAALGVLEAAGYALAGLRPPFGASRLPVWRRGWGAKDVTLRGPNGSMIELHNRPFSADRLLPSLGLADMRESVTIGGACFRSFGRPDLFAYLAVHGATTFWHRLKWLADLRALLAYGDCEELASLLAHCRELGVERCGALALLLCHRLWAQALPERVAVLLREDPALARLEARSLAMLFADPDSLPARERRRNFRASFDLSDAPGYRRSLLAATIYHDRLVTRVPLPRMLAPLYAPLRLVDYLARRG